MPTSRTLPEIGGALLEAAGAVELPVAHDRVQHASPGCAPNRSSRPTGTSQSHCVLMRVTEAGVASGLDVRPIVEAEERRAFLERVLIAAVERQAVREAAAQLDLQRVIDAERAAVSDADLVGMRIDDEEVGRQAGGDRVVAERQVVIEVASRIGVGVGRAGSSRCSRNWDSDWCGPGARRAWCWSTSACRPCRRRDCRRRAGH